MFEENEEFKQADFDDETMQLFEKTPTLMPKLTKLKERILKKIFDIIDNDNSQVKVSLLVYAGFKTLSSTEVT